MVMRLGVLLVATVVGCGGSDDAKPDAARDGAMADTAMDGAPEPLTFHCDYSAQCPEISIGGDLHSTDLFRGYGDPVLEKDPAGSLWLGYSWLDNETVGVDSYNAVRTHLAKSDDGGATFTFVKAVNASAPTPDNVGLVVHEVSSLARRVDGTWHHAWLTYAIVGSARVEFHYQRTQGASPMDLGAATDAWLRGTVTTVATQIDESQIVGAENCAAFTEPALFSHGGVNYLATTCIVSGQPATQRLILLRESGSALVLVGDLLAYNDAVALGGTRIEQIDLAVAQDGAVLAIVTPIDDSAAIPHEGCVVLEVEDLTTAKMKRDASGALVKRAVLTGAGNGIGPGLCTYDRDSSTGILMTLVQVTGNEIEFSLHRTGLHP